MCKSEPETLVGKVPNHFLPGPVDHMVEFFTNLDQYAEATRDHFERLTKREKRVLTLVAEGLSNPQIAVRIGISRATVQNHRANLRSKLYIGSEPEYVRLAVAHKLIAL